MGERAAEKREITGELGVAGDRRRGGRERGPAQQGTGGLHGGQKCKWCSDRLILKWKRYEENVRLLGVPLRERERREGEQGENERERE